MEHAEKNPRKIGMFSTLIFAQSKRAEAQIDTAQDAIYFGTWAHPKQFKTVSFAEGDTCIKTADTAEEFKTLIDEMVKFYVEDGSWKGIDPGLDEKNIQAWVDLGLKSTFALID